MGVGNGPGNLMSVEYLRFMSINVETIMLSEAEETRAFWLAVFSAATIGTSFEGILPEGSTPNQEPSVPPARDDSDQ